MLSDACKTPDPTAVPLTAGAVDSWRKRIREETLARYHFGMAMAIEREGNANAAEQAYRRAVAACPEMEESHFLLEDFLARAGRTEEVEAVRRAALAINPRYDVVGAFRLGQEAFVEERTEEAIRFFRCVGSRTSDCDEARIYLGIALARSGRAEQAWQEFPAAPRVAPGRDAEAIAAALLWQVAVPFFYENRYEDVLRATRLAARVQPDNGEVLTYIGTSLRMLGRNDEAERPLRLAAAASPTIGYCWTYIALWHQERLEFDPALRLLQRAAAIDGDPPGILMHLGTTLQAMGRMEDALATLQRVVKRRPGVGEFESALGLALLGADRLKDAAETLERAARTVDADVQASGKLGLVVRAMTLSNLGLAMQRLGRVGEALTLHREALSICSDRAWILTNLALALEENREADEALDMHKAAVRLQPQRLGLEACLRPWVSGALQIVYRRLGAPGFA